MGSAGTIGTSQDGHAIVPWPIVCTSSRVSLRGT